MSAASILAALVREIEDIDEAYWTHRLYGLIERAKAELAERVSA